jgi:large subunit ribosomal protein L24
MTQIRYKIKKGDTVQVTTGKNKGLKGVVEKVLLKDGKVLVAGVNEVTRHARPTQANPDGAYKKNLPIHISNVALVDPASDSISKVGIKEVDGKRVRYFKKSGNVVEGKVQ